MDFCFLNINNYEKKIESTQDIHDNLVSLRKNIIRDIHSNDKKYNHAKFNNIISNSLCDFIINESEKYALKNKSDLNKDGWTRTRHKNYPTTDLPIKEIDSLSILVNNIIRYDIFPLIEKTFHVNKYFLDCNDIFIVKYKENEQTKLERHKDGCAFSFNILLNDENDFEGGGTIINENKTDILVKNTKGGLILHSGQVFHSGNIITKGVRYILVGFISYLKGYDNRINKFNKNNNAELNLKSWQIDINDNYYDDINKFITNNKSLQQSFLLNTDKNISENIIEKIVYDLSVFHLERLKLNIDFSRYKIEFWWKNNHVNNNNNIIHGLHSDKDEILMRSQKKIISPLLSTITYLNDSIYPTLLTSTSQKDEINLKKGVVLSFPKKMKHVSFNGANYHGVFNIYDKNIIEKENRKTLMINIWDSHTPLGINELPKHLCIDKRLYLENILLKQNIEIELVKIAEIEMKELLQTIMNDPNLINKKFTKILSLLNIHNHDIIEFDI